MFVRIVKMEFELDKIDNFLSIFNSNSPKIRAVKGCQRLELYQDKNQANIFFTYSYWDDDSDLDNYRHSPLFTEVWSKTKLLFKNKPQAWSVDKVAVLK